MATCCVRAIIFPHPSFCKDWVGVHAKWKPLDQNVHSANLRVGISNLRLEQISLAPCACAVVAKSKRNVHELQMGYPPMCRTVSVTRGPAFFKVLFFHLGMMKLITYGSKLSALLFFSFQWKEEIRCFCCCLSGWNSTGLLPNFRCILWEHWTRFWTRRQFRNKGLELSDVYAGLCGRASPVSR